MSAWDVAARSGRGPPPVPSMIRRVRRDVTPRVAARAWAASYHRGAPRVSRGAPNVGVEECPGFVGALQASGLEECPGFAGALRTLGGMGGHFGAPHLFSPRSRRPPGAAR